MNIVEIKKTAKMSFFCYTGGTNQIVHRPAMAVCDLDPWRNERADLTKTVLHQVNSFER